MTRMALSKCAKADSASVIAKASPSSSSRMLLVRHTTVATVENWITTNTGDKTQKHWLPWLTYDTVNRYQVNRYQAFVLNFKARLTSATEFSLKPSIKPA